MKQNKPRDQGQTAQQLVDNLVNAAAMRQSALNTLNVAIAAFQTAANNYDAAVQSGNQAQITATGNALLSAAGVQAAAQQTYDDAVAQFNAAWTALGLAPQ